MKKHRAITLILFFALLTRIAIVLAVFLDSSVDFSEQFFWDADPQIYLNGAKQILNTGVNTFSFFPPLHFLFLAGCLSLGQGDLLIAALANVTVGWLTIIGVYLLAKNLYGERTGLIAAFISGFYPNFITYEISLYPEPLALLWIVFSFLMIARYFHTSGIACLAASGILWGLASQTRGGLHYFSIFAGITIAASLAGRSWKSRCKPVSIFLLSAYLTFLAVGIAAYPVQGDFSFDSKSGIGSVLHGANRITTSCNDYGNVRGRFFYSALKDEWPEGSQIFSKELLKLNTWQIGVKLIAFIKQDPFTYLKNAFIKLGCLWSPNQLFIYYLKVTGMKNADPLITNGVCLGIGLIYILIVCGALYGLSCARGPFLLLFLSLVFYYTVLIFLTVGNSKLRLPMMPFIIIYCSYGIFRLRDLFRSRLHASTWIALVVMVVFTGNSIYKCREFLPSPAEIDVREIELSNQLGFPRTALFLLTKEHRYPFSENQHVRMKTVKNDARAEIRVRLIEHVSKSGLPRRTLHYLRRSGNSPFSENQKERLRIIEENATAALAMEKAPVPGERLRKGGVMGDTYQQSYENHWLEAECPDSIVQPLTLASGDDSSEGRYLYAPEGTGHHYTPGPVMASYSVNISRPGNYILWGRVSILNGNHNSFFVQIDSSPDYLWEFDLGVPWHWNDMHDPGVLSLTEGQHMIRIKVREDGTKLDKMLLTNNPDFIPRGAGEVAENCR